MGEKHSWSSVEIRPPVHKEAKTFEAVLNLDV